MTIFLACIVSDNDCGKTGWLWGFSFCLLVLKTSTKYQETCLFINTFKITKLHITYSLYLNCVTHKNYMLIVMRVAIG